ncbi:sn-glycerol-1-phosphate dehydrogenase [Alicyclobacillus sp. SO9]|uniref:sn-glycerol-1-phosphate dehydrogenase n=1 Tax=Alicyclobacillus sp. SO9 TaxID=2665646 RepID=UPI0018E71DCE|nr:sn-glycerol-1-phosphate dehydrogenase [Alicyclobacillus sp. SO9]QQE77988.1 sn-glycerol-1-phosphate dehydrogenase [Alicyclobacillus sp. SO9]
MDVPAHLLNKSVKCACGMTHFVPIEEVAVHHDVQYLMAEYLERKKYRNLLLVADSNTFEVFGARLERYLQDTGFNVGTCIFSERHGLLPDEAGVQKVTQQIESADFDTVLAVGSGVINDLVRYSTFHQGLQYIAVATAPSMDGYASNMAAMQFDGLKVTSKAHPPQAIFADLSVLMDAPFELLQSGFGDLIGKVISLSDWLLAKDFYGEHFCQQSYNLVSEPLSYIIKNAAHLERRDSKSVKGLFTGLINSGIAMAMMGHSRPCSGSEHHCSHFWDLMAYKGHRGHASHGLQVGYATRWMTRFYRDVLHLDSVQEPVPFVVSDSFQQFAHRFYGAGADEVIQAQTAKSHWLKESPFQAQELTNEGLHSVLQPTTTMMQQLENALTVMSISSEPESLELSEELLRLTFEHAKDLRSRYTVFDFLEGQGLLAEMIDRAVLSLHAS